MVLSAVSVSTLVFVLLVPLGIMALLALFLVPALLAGTARPASVLRATYCYILQSFGIVLMSIGALPAVYGVLEKLTVGVERFTTEMYLALLILFSSGGITFLWHERLAEGLDDASRKIPALLFWYAFKAVGYLLMLFGLLSLLLTVLLAREPLHGTWWITPMVLGMYGALLAWCTRMPRVTGIGQLFPATPVHHLKKASKRK